MSREGEFAAEILETGASALAGYAVIRLFELAPEAREGFDDDAAEHWRAHLRSRLLELAVAVRMDEPRIFVNRVLWTRKAFRAREVPESHVESSLTSLADVLAEELPEAARDVVRRTLEPSLRALAEADDEDPGAIDPGTASGQLALRYLALVLEGDARASIDLLFGALESGMDPGALIIDVLFPVQREVGRLWHRAETNVAEEHLVTATTLRAIALLGRHGEILPANGRTVVAASVEGNDHELAIHALGVLFERQGWKSVVLGANVPATDLVRAVQYFGADLLVLSVTLSTQLRGAERTIAQIRALPEFDLRILVGGPAFDDSTDLWQRIGADGYAATLDAALAEGARLVDLKD